MSPTIPNTGYSRFTITPNGIWDIKKAEIDSILAFLLKFVLLQLFKKLHPLEIAVVKIDIPIINKYDLV